MTNRPEGADRSAVIGMRGSPAVAEPLPRAPARSRYRAALFALGLAAASLPDPAAIGLACPPTPGADLPRCASASPLKDAEALGDSLLRSRTQPSRATFPPLPKGGLAYPPPMAKARAPLGLRSGNLADSGHWDREVCNRFASRHRECGAPTWTSIAAAHRSRAIGATRTSELDGIRQEGPAAGGAGWAPPGIRVGTSPAD